MVRSVKEYYRSKCAHSFPPTSISKEQPCVSTSRRKTNCLNKIALTHVYVDAVVRNRLELIDLDP